MSMYIDIKKMEGHASHILLHMLHLIRKSYFFEQGNRTQKYMLEPIPFTTIKTIASMQLS